MTKVEKVITGFLCCYEYMFPQVDCERKDCPYYELRDCHGTLVKDAIKIIDMIRASENEGTEDDD